MKSIFQEKTLDDLRRSDEEWPAVGFDEGLVTSAVRHCMHGQKGRVGQLLRPLEESHRRIKLLLETRLEYLPLEEVKDLSEMDFTVKHVGPVMEAFIDSKRISSRFPNKDCETQKRQKIKPDRPDLTVVVGKTEIAFGEITGPAKEKSTWKNNWDFYRTVRYGKAFLDAGHKMAPLFQIVYTKGTYMRLKEAKRGMFVLEEVGLFTIPATVEMITTFMTNIQTLMIAQADIEKIATGSLHQLKRSWGYKDLDKNKRLLVQGSKGRKAVRRSEHEGTDGSLELGHATPGSSDDMSDTEHDTSDLTSMSAMQEPEQSVAIDVVGDGGIALSGVTFQDDSHLCAPLAGYDGDVDDDEVLEDPQPYQYVSDSEQEDSDGLKEEEDDYAPDGPPVLIKEEEKRADEEDFELWVEKDGHDHFFEWNFEKLIKSSTGRRSSNPYLWTRYFLCHREGQPRESKVSANMQSTEEPGNRDEPPKVKRSCTVYKPSCKAGCRAKMVVHKAMEDHLINRKRLRVTYYYRHTGHSLGDVDDFQHLRMTDDVRARIRNLVRLGLSTRAICSRIHVQGRQAGILFGQGSLQRDHVPT
ncbi:hypothetical protein BGX23_002374 [Mortierella sp. AD031]|nr:hypothetical protein BGX23_002374 [Mortierella sp. AD031]